MLHTRTFLHCNYWDIFCSRAQSCLTMLLTVPARCCTGLLSSLAILPRLPRLPQPTRQLQLRQARQRLKIMNTINNMSVKVRMSGVATRGGSKRRWLVRLFVRSLVWLFVLVRSPACSMLLDRSLVSLQYLRPWAGSIARSFDRSFAQLARLLARSLSR